jgi:hypothetical protein
LLEAKDKLAASLRGEAALTNRIEAIRGHLLPQYQVLSRLFSNQLVEDEQTQAHADNSAYTHWLAKCPKDGIRRMLQVMIERKKLTRTQLATLSGVGRNTAYEYAGWLKRNGLVKTEGGDVELLPL